MGWKLLICKGMIAARIIWNGIYYPSSTTLLGKGDHVIIPFHALEPQLGANLVMEY